MSDAGHLGDAARLGAALDRIARALERDAAASAAAREADKASSLAQAGVSFDVGDVMKGVGEANVDAVALRLDRLIVELRDVLGAAPGATPA